MLDRVSYFVLIYQARVTSLAMQQSYDYPIASEETLMGMGKTEGSWITTKYNKLCVYFMGYTVLKMKVYQYLHT